ncbi:MAG: BatD family protein [Pirellulales bacterium]
MSGRTLITTATAILAFVPTFALAAEPVDLRVSVDKTVAQVAEPIRLVVEVAAPRDTRVELPQLADKLGEFEVRSSERTRDIPAAAGADSRRWVLEATLETIKTGELTIPPLGVHYTTDAKTTTFKTLRSKPIQVRITSVLENRADPTKFRDIKDTVDVVVPELHSYAWLGWTAAGFGTAAALVLLAVVVVKRKRGPSPAKWALAAIADVEQLAITNAADAEATYNESVDVIREFFELEFNVPALTRTTREFLAQAANVVGLSKTARERLTSLSSIADEIKFARLGVGEQQVRQALDQARAFVNECDAHRRASEKEAV